VLMMSLHLIPAVALVQEIIGTLVLLIVAH
jgi:hypothetical protein